jgi:hypothetical protein
MSTQADQAAEVALLVKAQGASRERLATAAQAATVSSIRGFHDWYDTAAITKWADALAKLIEAYQRQAAAVTNSYMSRVASIVLGKPVPTVSVVDISGLRQGVTRAGVYGRIADTYRFAVFKQQEYDALHFPGIILPEGESFSSVLNVDPPKPPLEAAIERGRLLVDTDVSLAVREQSHEFMTKAKPTPIGWRRVIHPELSKTGTCGLCIVASHRVYSIEELQPLHDHCHCLPTPIYKGSDPGSVINKQDLERLYAEAGSTAAAALKKTRYEVNEHGELGPVLRVAGQRFRDPAQLKKDRDKPFMIDAERARKTLTVLEASIVKQREKLANDPRLQKSVDFTERRIADLRKQLSI